MRDSNLKHLQRMPDKSIPELQALSEKDWLTVAKDAKLNTEVDIQRALSELRSAAWMNLPIGGALSDFIRANNGELLLTLHSLPFF